ncbi:MAG: YebC/PmpR family DNA-binding transcriptional regulator [bacterium]
MSGHSKWNTIKRKKAATDSAKGKVFTRLAREIITSARAGGGDPEMNARLRSAVAAARAANMPGANIEKAIKRGTGEIEGITYEEASFEGYGPGGVALFIDVVTDNRNRTVAEIRYLLTRHNGSLGEAGCVAWMFEQKGSILVKRNGREEDAILELALEAGAEDVTTAGDMVQITTAPSSLFAVREALEEKGLTVTSAEFARIPQNTVRVEGKEAELLLKLLDALEDQDDTQRVSANFDVPEELMQAQEE